MGPRLTVLETAMNRLSVCIALIACLSPLAAQADRITTMTREEKCVYVARLQVAAAFYYAKGQRRDEVKIHWHGDETANEREFVTRTIDQGYQAMERESREGKAGIPVELIGDRAYQSCMTETAL